MTYKEMLALMGQIVTVHQNLIRVYATTELDPDHLIWVANDVTPWAGWVVGFGRRFDGRIIYDNEEGYTVKAFKQTKCTACALVRGWPTRRECPVPLGGFTLGGVPQSPDNGGWRTYASMKAKASQ